MPKGIFYAAILLTLLSWVPLALAVRMRVESRTTPRIHIFLDMDVQSHFKPQETNPMFADNRAMRPQVPGTIALGELKADQHLYRGKIDGEFADTFPMDVTMELLERGKQRYDIYCAVCHGATGFGDGIINKRAELLAESGAGSAWITPSDYSSGDVPGRSVGHLYNTITNGLRTMPAYGSQIPTEDRWAIVAYVKALQRAGSGTIDDVPADQREALSNQMAEAKAAAEKAAAEEAAEAAKEAGDGTEATPTETSANENEEQHSTN